MPKDKKPVVQAQPDNTDPNQNFLDALALTGADPLDLQAIDQVGMDPRSTMNALNARRFVEERVGAKQNAAQVTPQSDVPPPPRSGGGRGR